MKTTSICLAAVVAFTANTYADKDIDYSHLPPRVQQTIREYKGQGEVRKVKTKRLENGQVVYEVDYKERGDEKQVLIGQDGFAIGDEQQVDKDHGKGKGKAKGHQKDKAKGKGKDKDREDEEEQAITPSPAAAPSPVPAPATSQPAPGSVQPTPPVAASTPTPTPAPPQSQRPGERALAFERQVKAVNALAANEKALQVGLAVIEKESGLTVKTLQALQEQYPAGPAGLLMATELSRLKKRPAQQFLADRNGKGGWDAIAERNGVNPDLLLPKLQRLHRAMAEAAK